MQCQHGLDASSWGRCRSTVVHRSRGCTSHAITNHDLLAGFAKHTTTTTTTTATTTLPSLCVPGTQHQKHWNAKIQHLTPNSGECRSIFMELMRKTQGKASSRIAQTGLCDWLATGAALEVWMNTRETKSQPPQNGQKFPLLHKLFTQGGEYVRFLWIYSHLNFTNTITLALRGPRTIKEERLSSNSLNTHCLVEK